MNKISQIWKWLEPHNLYTRKRSLNQLNELAKFEQFSLMVDCSFMNFE